jgi:hypothetical protein
MERLGEDAGVAVADGADVQAASDRHQQTIRYFPIRFSTRLMVRETILERFRRGIETPDPRLRDGIEEEIKHLLGTLQTCERFGSQMRGEPDSGADHDE